MPNSDGTGWEQVSLDGEDKIIADFASFVRNQVAQAQTADSNPRRFQHNKEHLAVNNARVQIDSEIPEKFRQGLFQPDAVYEDVTVRLSNAKGLASQPDGNLDLRGMAVRIPFEGRKFDLLATNAAQHHLRNAAQFAAFSRATADGAEELMTEQASELAGHDAARLEDRLSSIRHRISEIAKEVNTWARLANDLGGTDQLIRMFGILGPQLVRSKLARTLATQTFFSRAPFRLGDRAVKYCFRGLSQDESNHGNENDAAYEGSYLSLDLRARLQEGPLEYAIELQLFDNADTTPIEDTSIEWTTSFQRIGKLVIPRQDIGTEGAKRIAQEVNGMAFTPWRHVVDLDGERFLFPIGSMNRARRPVYQGSAEASGRPASHGTNSTAG